ncbi:hypothetical protein ACFVU3_03390 [Streptomyces sp. NPDC058052]|uniref:hypothetical protein n=1 Tax=Streptomyces sp. NPDC058052 TaxID=3346316 RepID=UPI0036E57A69
MIEQDLATVRLALSPNVARSEVGAFFIRITWVLRSLEEGSVDEPYEEVWSDRNGIDAAFYVEDDLVGVHYLTLEAQPGKRIESLVGRVRAGLNVLDSLDVVTWVREASTLEERAVAAGHLGLATESPDSAVIAAFRELLLGESIDSVVRKAALVSSAYAAWEELDGVLSAVASSDPDREVRAVARRVLRSVRRSR